jgi:hypothetical protein
MMPSRARPLLAAAMLTLALAARAQITQDPAALQSAQPGASSASQPGSVSSSANSSLAQAVLPENPFMRFEIVSLGSFPIMIFYTGFAFDLALYIENGYDSYYAPWPFANSYSYSANLSETDREKRILVALGGCAVVGIIDAIIHANKIKRARFLQEAGKPSSSSSN